MRRGRTHTLRLALAAAAGVLLAAWFPAGAGAVTIGSDLQPAPPEFLGYGCGVEDPCTVQQTFLPGNPNPMSVPFDGRIRKWRFRKGSDQTYEIRLRVVRRTQNGRWRFIRSSGPRTVGSLPGVYTFRSRLRVEEGDRIAIDLPAAEDVEGGVITQISVPLDGARANAWFPAPADGTAPPPSDSDDYEYLWNATARRR